MTLGVVITTFNRPQECLVLVKSLLLEASLVEVIVVDSGEKKYGGTQDKRERIIRTKHKNQPYQRYVGYAAAKSDVLLYLDDDMQLLNNKWLELILNEFRVRQIIALNLPFQNKNAFLDAVEKSFINKQGAVIRKWKGILTGYPDANPNAYLYCGIRGPRVSENPIEYLSGGCLAVKRNELYKNFNFSLFDMYENKLGKGEDGILGYTLSKNGIIWALKELLFLHNDLEDSSYSQNHESFSRKVMFSRKYLSCEYYRLSNKATWRGVLRYLHYGMFRIIGAWLMQLLKPTTNNKNILKGYLKGFKLALKYTFVHSDSIQHYWNEEMLKDIHGING